jgi:hypothetical protein
MRFQVGNQEDKWFNPDGTPTVFGFERLKNIFENLPTQKVSSTDPTAAQTLKYNAVTKQYEPG